MGALQVSRAVSDHGRAVEGTQRQEKFVGPYKHNLARGKIKFQLWMTRCSLVSPHEGCSKPNLMIRMVKWWNSEHPLPIPRTWTSLQLPSSIYIGKIYFINQFVDVIHQRQGKAIPVYIALDHKELDWKDISYISGDTAGLRNLNIPDNQDKGAETSITKD